MNKIYLIYLCPILIYFFLLNHFPYGLVDDAYIPMTYARNLVEGHGIVFYPGGERVEGFTSPLWMFVLSIFAFVKLSLPAAAFYGGILFGAERSS